MFDFLLRKKKHEKVVVRSIYERLVDEIDQNDGKVSDGFLLETKNKNGVNFSLGTLEGVSRHHSSGFSKSDGSCFKLVKRLLGMPKEAALSLFEQDVADEFCMAAVRKEFYNEILSNKEKLSPDRVANLGYYFAFRGSRVESVKLGLTLLGLLNIEMEEEILKLLKVLGLYEEFTDYVTFIMRNWPENEKQDIYFEFAKKLSGWGKISVVEDLVVNSEEKRNWILCYGCSNNISNSYLAGICADKGMLEKVFRRGKLSKDEFAGATSIISGFVEDGPVKYVFDDEKNSRLLLLYLDEVAKHKMTLELASLLCNIITFFKNNHLSLYKKVEKIILNIFKNVDFDKILNDGVLENTVDSINVAKFLEKDISLELIKVIEKDFKKYYSYCYYLFDENKCIDEFFNLCDKYIKSDDYPNKMGSESGFGLIEGIDIRVDFIVERLNNLPNRGKKLIAICLNSPYIRWRNMAVFTLKSWVEILGKKLNCIDSELYNLVNEIYKIECNEYTKGELKKLL